jgi:hypothetical protein
MSGHVVKAPSKPETMRLRTMASGNKNNWNIDEQHYLLLHHKDMFIEDIAEELGRTVKATKNKAFRMGCSIKIKPTSE